jgi:hypothetical protein
MPKEGDVRPPAPKPGQEFKNKDGQTYVVCDSGTCTNIIEGKKIRCRNEDCKKPCKCMLLIAPGREWKLDPNDPDDDGWYPYDEDEFWVYCACLRPKVEP